MELAEDTDDQSGKSENKDEYVIKQISIDKPPLAVRYLLFACIPEYYFELVGLVVPCNQKGKRSILIPALN